MNGPSHMRLVKLALDCLSADGVPDGFAEGMGETCMLPDERAIALLTGEGGEWRRLFPPNLPPFNFEIRGRDARAFFPRSGFFIRNVIACLRRGDAREAGRFAGVFSHYLGDFAEPAHYYELDVGRLLPPPPHMRNCNYHMMVESIESGVQIIRHRPRLLGASVQEFEFRLEGRLARLHGRAVAAVVPMVRSIYRRDRAAASRRFDPVMREAAAVLADFCHTALCIASGRFGARELARLRVCNLREAEPQACDVEFNFSRRPLVDWITRDSVGRAEPLRLRLRRGGRTVAERVRGICVIPHALPLPGVAMSASLEYRLPRGTYATLEAAIGLLAGEPRQARCRFEVRKNGRLLYRSREFAPGDGAERITVDVRDRRELVLCVRTDGSTDRLAYPIWGEPRLIKA